jgi:hypothetical protein
MKPSSTVISPRDQHSNQMITPGEISRSVFGAWMLARFNPDGLNFFDNTVEGFWRSFWAAAIALPAFAYLLTLRYSAVTIGVDGGTSFYVNCVSYVLNWVAFPYAMFYVARLFNRDQWYCRYIAAYNWAGVLQITLMLIISPIAAGGLLPSAPAFMISAISILFIMVYKGYIARVALQTTIPGAVGIVFLDLCLSLMLHGWTDKLLKVQPIASG